jgi:hypothetical protein
MTEESEGGGFCLYCGFEMPGDAERVTTDDGETAHRACHERYAEFGESDAVDPDALYDARIDDLLGV